MLNVIFLILGLCVLGAIVMIVYAFLTPTDDTRVCVDEKTPLELESMDADKAVFTFTVPVAFALMSPLACSSASLARLISELITATLTASEAR